MGRARELDDLGRALGEAGALVTVWGPPGVGKTRLVEELARRTGLPMVFVRTLDALDEASFVTRVCLALGIPDRTHGRLVDLGGSLLHAAERNVVLVLDELDGLAPALSASIAALRRDVPTLRILVTTREVLGLPGERVLSLDALPTDDAVELLVSRAEVLWYWTREDELPRLNALVERFDRLPLALELGANWLSVLGPRGLEEFLEANDPRDAGTVLERTISRSWASLAPDERNVLSSLSVFRGELDADAAASTCGMSRARTLELLEALVAKALVTVRHEEGRVRLSLLLSVREFAARRLADAGSTSRAERAHAAHYARAVRGWIEQLDGAAPAEGMSALRGHREELIIGALRGDPRVRIELALALERLLSVDGPFGLLSELLDRAGDAARSDPSISDELVHRLLAARAEIRRRLGDAEAALALAAEIPEGACPEAGIRATLTRGFVAFVRSDLEAARAHAAAAIERAATTREERLECQARFLAGNVAMALGDHHSASEHGERALQTARRNRWQREAAAQELFLGSVRIDEGRTADAELLCESARSRVPSGIDRLYDSNVAVLDAMIAHRRGRLEAAKSSYLDAADHARRLGGSGWLAAVHEGYAAVALAELGHAVEARALLGRVLERVRSMEDRRYEALFEAHLGCVELADADGRSSGIERARTRVERARALAESAGDHGFAGAIGYLQALVLHAECVRAASEGRADDASRLHRARRQLVADSDARGRDAQGRVRSLEAYVSRRMYEAALGQLRPADEAPRDALVVGPAFGWFRAPRGEVVDLVRKPVLRALVRALIEGMGESQKLGRDALRRAAWGDERMSDKAAGTRLRVALAALRKLGLRDVLRHDSAGWWLELELPVVRIEEGDRHDIGSTEGARARSVR